MAFIFDNSAAGSALSSFSDLTFFIYDGADLTTQLRFDVAGTVGTRTTIKTSQTANIIVTIPSISGNFLLDTTDFPATSGSRAVPQPITAVGGIPFTSLVKSTIIWVQGSGGPVVVTANPQIAAGFIVGQRLTLIGRSAVNTLTLSDGTGLDLNGTCVLDDNGTLNLLWDGTNWHEESRR